MAAHACGERDDDVLRRRARPRTATLLLAALAAAALCAQPARAATSAAAWGMNSHWELGGGFQSPFSGTPVQVAGLTGIKSVASGYGFTMALLEDGTVWAWGG